VPFRALDAGRIGATLDQLSQRISVRFPEAGLGKVCAELVKLARETQGRADKLAKPNLGLRVAITAVLLGFGILVVLGLGQFRLEFGDNGALELMSGLEAGVNLLVLTVAAVVSLVTIEARTKRAQALKALHELRSIIHVIDMHQLTKSPPLTHSQQTSASPKRELSGFELTRYLDYCSEMLSLTSKLAAIYAQNVSDAAVVEAASDIENLATNLSQKVWQKITIIEMDL
jgi:hypothetical protein